MDTQIGMWAGFGLFVLAMLALDLGVFHKEAHEVHVKEALGWSAVWIALALAFNAILYFWRGPEVALQFLTGYLIEKSLSVDNIFVFLLLFSYFRIPAAYQHKVLFWGILGALVMRGLLIVVGVALIHRFHWIIYVFGVFLILTGIRMAFKQEETDPGESRLYRFLKRRMRVTDTLEGDKFFVWREGRRYATPLFLVLILVETTDLVFAVDSIPAILAISTDPFIVFTSNVFAILGLRALYFAVAGLVAIFHYLHYGLSAILIFVGAKMLLVDIYKIPVGLSLGVIAALLALSVLASKLWPVKEEDIVPEVVDPVEP